MTGRLAPIDPHRLLDPVTLAIPLFVLAVLVEMVVISRGPARARYSPGDSTTSLLTGLVSNLAGPFLAIGGGYVAFMSGHVRVGSVPTNALTLALLFVLDDLSYYWSHRFSHTIRWFWGNHVVHHSSQHYNLTTALRQPWFSGLTGHVIFMTPLLVLGFDPAAIGFVGSANLVYQFWIHTETIDRMPAWFELVFNTPSHHRVHHATNPEYLDRNFAGTFIVWDRLFGTFVAEDPAIEIRYGVVKNIGTRNPLRIATHEFVAIWRDATRPGLSLSARLGYMFASPGWSHDGTGATSKDIRAAWRAFLAEGRRPATSPAPALASRLNAVDPATAP